MNASFNARKTSLGDIGLESSLTYSLFLRACTGYAQMVQFRKEYFLCPNCGDSPEYIVCDRKTAGPAKHHLITCMSLIDQRVMKQFCVFLSNKCERNLVCGLLTNSVSPDEFLESVESEERTESLNMVGSLVERISLTWPDKVGNI